MSVAVCLHLWLLGKRKNAVCVGARCVGVACQSWFAGAAVQACGAAFAEAVMLHAHTWLCMCVPVCARVSPCPGHAVCDSVSAAVPWTHVSMSACGHL